jgi:Leucine-rich repeat (LRR) protein
MGNKNFVRMRTILLFALMGTLTLLTISAQSATVKSPTNGEEVNSRVFSQQTNSSGSTLRDKLQAAVKTSTNERFAKIKGNQLARLEAAELAGSDGPLNAPVIPCNTSDSLALVDLYNATNGATWANATKKWLVPGTRVANWFGVTVSAGRVVSLALPNNSLNGSVPVSFGNLSALYYLDFSNNSLSGTFPDQFTLMVNMEYINLSYNQFSGAFPASIGNLTTLFELYVSNNSFSGVFPSEISDISSLYYLDVSSNQFTGNILNYLSGQVNIMSILASYNHFTGNISADLGDLSSLTELNVKGNNFTFLNLEGVFSWPNYGSLTFSYNEQENVGQTTTIERYIGQSFHISIVDFVPSESDEFQWYRNGSILSGKTDSIIDVASATRSNAGEYYCEITNSGVPGLTLYSNTVTVNILNHVPVANAGPDQSKNEGLLVTLDASGSTDGDNDPLTYQWTAPLGITLSNSTAQKPTFTAPDVTVNTTFRFLLVVNDGYNLSLQDTVFVEVLLVNVPPVANAGSDQTVDEQTTVVLNGAASSDADGHTLTYDWTAPDGITLNDNTAQMPTFLAPNITADTTLAFSLVVNDGYDNSARDTVLINISLINIPPVANAGPDQTVDENSEVALDGSASSDADGHPLTFLWSAPLGITLSDNTIENPVFTAPEIPKDSTFSFVLVVNDGYDNSERDTVVINVSQVNKIPVAHAGIDQSANREGDLITLDGSASTDGDGDPLTYNWSAPVGITLNDSTLAVPTFIMPDVNSDTTFTIVLVVYDSFEYSAPDTVAISVINNLVPTANAGTDQTVEEGDLVQLSAAGSSDGNSDPLTYNWSAPEGIVLNDSTASNPTFTAPEVAADTTFTIVLVVNDGFEDSAPDTVAFLVQNSAAVPETLAIENETVGVGQTNCYDALQTITVAGNSTTVTFQNGSTVEIIAGQRINFLPGFRAQSGSVVHAHISATFCNPPASIVFAEKGVVIDEDIRPDMVPTGIKEVKVYPNPTTGKFTVELTNYNQPVTVSVYNMRGSRVATTTAGNAAEFDMGHLSKGLYMVQVAGDNTVQTKKIVIE